ncbi:hypothetical protein OsccyDRAFT_0446 [Leptolyngbyaceae cyanobacterium JSC-12]|nr:hypothetical protein OsccyDRAFT_0446 [Leptolyngbyaceae cyanobacterium JSC-12]
MQRESNLPRILGKPTLLALQEIATRPTGALISACEHTFNRADIA